MGTRKSRCLPTPLDGVRRRFEHWRRTRKVLSRVPEPLWAAAVNVAGKCGISHTAKTLRVNYNVLKKRVEHQAAVGPSGSGAIVADQRFASVPAFVELAPPARVGYCQCTVEWEDDSGAKMRVHLQSAETPDLAAMSRSFWELRS